jgi:hypothetical protein
MLSLLYAFSCFFSSPPPPLFLAALTAAFYARARAHNLRYRTIRFLCVRVCVCACVACMCQ